MRSSSRVLVAVVFAALSLTAITVQGAEEKVSRALEKPLKAANDAFQAKKYDEAIAKAKEAQAVENRTAYDNYVINELLGASYARSSRFPEAYTSLSANADSPFLDAKAKGARYVALTQLAYVQKDYGAAIDWANKAIAAGQDTTDTRVLIAQAYFLQNKCKEAITAMQEVVGRAEKAGQRPAEASLLVQFQCYTKLNDQNGQGRVIEKLVTYYPKPDYWLNAMITLIQSSDRDDRLRLQVLRLMSDVGALKRSDQYGEMARIAVEQGYPGEAVKVLEEGMTKNVFTELRDKERNTRLLEASRKAVAVEKDNIAKSEQEAMRSGSPDLMVAVGSSYLFNFSDAGKAATLIAQGIAKGPLQKIPLNDAYVTLGLAYARAKNAADADKAFGKVDKNEAYERLAKLWSLRVH